MGSYRINKIYFSSYNHSKYVLKDEYIKLSCFHKPTP